MTPTNTALPTVLPTNITAKIFGMKPKPNFTVEDEAAISKAPQVNFDNQPTPAPAGR